MGLSGTGDTFRNAAFTQQAVQGMLQNLGVNMRGLTLGNRNVAAAIVTADLSAASRPARASTSPSPPSATRPR